MMNDIPPPPEPTPMSEWSPWWYVLVALETVILVWLAVIHL